MLPTMAEAGVAEGEVHSWTGLSAPVGAPPAIIEHRNRALREVLAATDRHRFVDNLGSEVADASAQEFGALPRAETGRWAAFVKWAGIVTD